MAIEYDPSDEGPEAKFAREEQRRIDRLYATIDNLLYSLTPLDAARVTFTWAEIQEFKMRRRH